ncbi:hypothetical protein PVL29_018492 [Vitis rotundifolia]|uniref:Mon2/Sec7/BIG1-like dimerisation and cyclophilin-binding domain-containing protein n=1 Tax=Vitis rotundifolia TaxID=103349 RepID=A0AA38Z556_VITRO|nr:hypothetical protein PVL29_018492 [Vitis rotundifolia]
MVCSCVDNLSSHIHGKPLLGVIRICYIIALNSKSPINQATSKAMLTQMISIIFRRMETDPVCTSSGSAANKEATLADNLNYEVETSSGDQTEKEMTLGDALSMNQVKDIALASVEELQNLAGGVDIKGLEAVLDKAVHLEDGKKMTRGINMCYLSKSSKSRI